MNDYKGFKILQEYPNDDNTSNFVAFVWCKGTYYKAHIYGKDIEDTMWGLGETEEEALAEAINGYWAFEITEHYYG